jgi:hypothetical protein
MASGAKFNLDKTEILPISTKPHRERVIQQHKLNDLDEPWHDMVNITKDGNPIRMLGA